MKPQNPMRVILRKESVHLFRMILLDINPLALVLGPLMNAIITSTYTK